MYRKRPVCAVYAQISVTNADQTRRLMYIVDKDMTKKNCWEFKKCGRQPGGDKAIELGKCPAAIETRLNGTNSGRNGGRACWAIAGTLCEGKMQGSFATKVRDCLQCEFYQLVRAEEGENHESAKKILDKLH